MFIELHWFVVDVCMVLQDSPPTARARLICFAMRLKSFLNVICNSALVLRCVTKPLIVAFFMVPVRLNISSYCIVIHK